VIGSNVTSCARVVLLVVVCLWTMAGSVFGEPQHRPLNEMHGGCASFDMDVRTELRTMAGAHEARIAWPGRGEQPAMLMPMRPVEIRLLPRDHVALTVPPKRAAAYAGMVAFSVPEGGRYRISSGQPVRIEIVEENVPMEAAAFEMQTECPALFKVVVFPLKGGRLYWLELSSDVRDVAILLTPDVKGVL